MTHMIFSLKGIITQVGLAWGQGGSNEPNELPLDPPLVVILLCLANHLHPIIIILKG